jgi:hypothetical protein
MHSVAAIEAPAVAALLSISKTMAGLYVHVG